MPFRDPKNFLVLPPGLTPPVTGQPIIFLTPGPDQFGSNSPEIRFYTGDADEAFPGSIRGFSNAFGAMGMELLSAKRSNSTRRASLDLFTGADGSFEVSQFIGHAALVQLDAKDPSVSGRIELITDGSTTAFTDTLINLGDDGGSGIPIIINPAAGYFTDAARMKVKSARDNTAFNTLTNTTYAATSTPLGLTFIAPPSGRGLLICYSMIQLSTVANVARTALSTPWLGTGTTIDAGTATLIEGVTPPSDGLRFNHKENDQAVVVTSIAELGEQTYHVQNLTPGDNYNASLRHRITSATSADYDVILQAIRWVPLVG